MKKVIIAPGCVSCGTCQVICPQVFEVTDICHVKNDADFVKYVEKIIEATRMCPVGVIEIEGMKNERIHITNTEYLGKYVMIILLANLVFVHLAGTGLRQ